MKTFLFSIVIVLLLVEVRHTLDLMKFYDKTESRITYVTTHDAVVDARNAMNTGIEFFSFSQYLSSSCLESPNNDPEFLSVDNSV